MQHERGGWEGGAFLRQGHRGYFGLNFLSGLWPELKGREWGGGLSRQALAAWVTFSQTHTSSPSGKETRHKSEHVGGGVI